MHTIYWVGRQVMEMVCLNVFFEFPLLAIFCMAAAVFAELPVEHLENIQPNPFHDRTYQTVVLEYLYPQPLALYFRIARQ